MFSNIFHQYSHYANRTLAWLPADSETRYENNLSTNYNQLKEYDWIDKKFTYRFNTHGFRSDEFTDDPSVMFLGCSNTCGIGLPIEQTWAHIVSNELKLKMINLGIGGSGPDTAFRLANHYISELRPKMVVFHQPSNLRFTLIGKHNLISDFNPSGNIPSKFETFYHEWASNEENFELNGLKHRLAIEAICARNNVKLVVPDDTLFRHDFARDLMHAGVKSNEKFSKDVLNCIGRA